MPPALNEPDDQERNVNELLIGVAAAALWLEHKGRVFQAKVAALLCLAVLLAAVITAH